MPTLGTEYGSWPYSSRYSAIGPALIPGPWAVWGAWERLPLRWMAIWLHGQDIHYGMV